MDSSLVSSGDFQPKYDSYHPRSLWFSLFSLRSLHFWDPVGLLYWIHGFQGYTIGDLESLDVDCVKAEFCEKTTGVTIRWKSLMALSENGVPPNLIHVASRFQAVMNFVGLLSTTSKSAVVEV